jgi:hypothetical protein
MGLMVMWYAADDGARRPGTWWQGEMGDVCHDRER